MSKSKDTLVEIAQDAIRSGKHIALYFGGQKLISTEANLDKSLPGVLICESPDEDTFCIDIDSLHAVMEVEPAYVGPMPVVI